MSSEWVRGPEGPGHRPAAAETPVLVWEEAEPRKFVVGSWDRNTCFLARSGPRRRAGALTQGLREQQKVERKPAALRFPSAESGFLLSEQKVSGPRSWQERCFPAPGTLS